MAIDLDVLGTIVNNRIMSNIKSGYNVAMKSDRFEATNTKLFQEAGSLGDFRSSGSHSTIFSLGGGPGDRGLFFRFHANRRLAKEKEIHSDEASSVNIRAPIGVRKSL